MQLHVDVQGEGFPVLCLHGHPGKSGSMSVFTNHLSQRFQTIAPDLRGYGKSRPVAPFEMTDHLLDLEELMQRLQIDRCLLLGWSLGGIVALELALRFPERVSGMILVASAARPWGNHPPVSWQDNLFTGIASIANRFNPGGEWNIETFGKRSLYRYLVQHHTAATYEYLAAEAMPAYLQTSSQATRALYSALKKGYNRIPEVAAIQCPVLVLAAEGDRHITAASSQETAQRLPHAEYHCYPNTAHLFPWEIPAQVLTDIDDWLQREIGCLETQIYSDGQEA
jgi:pimeloyl-ACP methyl ester carboxylesterase